MPNTFQTSKQVKQNIVFKILGDLNGGIYVMDKAKLPAGQETKPGSAVKDTNGDLIGVATGHPGRSGSVMLNTNVSPMYILGAAEPVYIPMRAYPALGLHEAAKILAKEIYALPTQDERDSSLATLEQEDASLYALTQQAGNDLVQNLKAPYSSVGAFKMQLLTTGQPLYGDEPSTSKANYIYETMDETMDETLDEEEQLYNSQLGIPYSTKSASPLPSSPLPSSDFMAAWKATWKAKKAGLSESDSAFATWKAKKAELIESDSAFMAAWKAQKAEFSEAGWEKKAEINSGFMAAWKAKKAELSAADSAFATAWKAELSATDSAFAALTQQAASESDSAFIAAWNLCESDQREINRAFLSRIGKRYVRQLSRRKKADND